MIAAASALVSISCGPMVPLPLPNIKPLSTADCIASADHPVGKSEKDAAADTVRVAGIMLKSIIRTKSTDVAFLRFFIPHIPPIVTFIYVVACICYQPYILLR